MDSLHRPAPNLYSHVHKAIFQQRFTCKTIITILTTLRTEQLALNRTIKAMTAEREKAEAEKEAEEEAGKLAKQARKRQWEEDNEIEMGDAKRWLAGDGRLAVRDVSYADFVPSTWSDDSTACRLPN